MLVVCSDNEILAGVLAYNLRKKRKSKRRWFWIHRTNTERKNLGEYHCLIVELWEDEERFHLHFRLTVAEFDEQFL